MSEKITAWYEEPLQVRQASKNPNWVEQCKYWDFWIDWNGVVTQYRSPAGYVCDGASIPRLAWPIVGGRTDMTNIPLVGHDLLFLTHVVPFWVANEVGRQLIIQAGKPKWQARLIHAAVSSVFGKMAWRNTPEHIAELTEVRQIIKASGELPGPYQSLWYPDKTYD